jgi:hypothetical protein
MKGGGAENRPPPGVPRKRMLRQQLAEKKSYSKKTVAEKKDFAGNNG